MLRGIAIVAVVLSLTQAYPVLVAELVTMNLLLAAPALAVFVVAALLSRNRRRTMLVVGISILIGWLISPTVYVSWSRPPTFFDRFRVDFYSIWMFMLCAAIAGSILDLLITCASLNTNANNA